MLGRSHGAGPRPCRSPQMLPHCAENMEKLKRCLSVPSVLGSAFSQLLGTPNEHHISSRSVGTSLADARGEFVRWFRRIKTIRYVVKRIFTPNRMVSGRTHEGEPHLPRPRGGGGEKREKREEDVAPLSIHARASAWWAHYFSQAPEEPVPHGEEKRVTRIACLWSSPVTRNAKHSVSCSLVPVYSTRTKVYRHQRRLFCSFLALFAPQSIVC